MTVHRSRAAKLSRCVVGAAVIALCALPARSAYKSADQLKSEFATFLGKDAGGNQRYARLAWWHALGTGINDYSEGNTQIYVLDSKDGVCRNLTGGSFSNTSGWLNQPSVTIDGKRVIFCGPGSVYVINWDGSGLRQILTGWDLSRIWRHPTEGTDWVLVARSDAKVDGAYAAIYRINIDDTSKQVLLWDRTPMDQSKWGFWQSLSPDGKRLAGDYPWADVGWVSADNTGDVHWINMTGSSYQGCWVSIAKDASYDILGTWNDHTVAGLWRNSTNTTTGIPLSKGFYPTGTIHVFEFLRWSNDRDILTSSYKFDDTDHRILGPVVQRISDPATYVNLQDQFDYSAANCDMVVYTGAIGGPIAPSIVNPGRVNVDLNKAIDITILVNGDPAPTLTAAGLPAGLTLQAGATPANAFHITGTVTAAGTSTVTLNATNSQGADQETFTIVASSANQAPAVNAGPDLTVRLGHSAALAGTAIDDGKPGPLTVAWTQVAGPGVTTFTPPNTATTGALASATGVYRYELSGSDGALTTRDTVQVTVLDSLPFKVLQPVSGEQVVIGGTCTVRWQIDPPVGMSILLSRDAGLNYQRLTGTTVGTDGSTSFQWQVSDTLKPSTECVIAVEIYNSSVRATSELFSLIDASAVHARAVQQSGPRPWTIARTASGILVPAPGRSSLRDLRILSSDGKILYHQSRTMSSSRSWDVRLPPGLYLYEMRDASNRTERGFVPMPR